MKINIQIQDEVLREIYLPAYLLIKDNKRKWQSALAIFALGGGFLSLFIGAALDLIAWFASTGITPHHFHKISLVFYAITLPLLALGAHCLDLLEKNSSLSSAGKKTAERLDIGLKA